MRGKAVVAGIDIDIIDVDMNKIQNISFTKKLIPRILGFGTLNIDTAGHKEYEAVIPGVPRVKSRESIITAVMEKDFKAVKEHKKRVTVEDELKDRKEEIKQLKQEIKEMDLKLDQYEKLEKKLEEQMNLLTKIKEKK